MAKSVAAARAEADERLVEGVKERYGEIARSGGSCSPVGAGASCCGGGSQPVSLQIGYEREDQVAVPEGADLGLGCGAPIPHLELKPGETVLDLGSGGGLDAFLAARAVGPSGRVIGVDMTPAMLERARANAEKGGFNNVEFHEGRLEALPVETASVDAVTSNCVVNLVPDKAAVFREIARVLKPGGRVVISDILLDGPLPESLARDVYAYVGCISGAALRGDYFAMLEAAGLRETAILKDVDYLASLIEAAPAEAEALLGRHGLRREAVLGLVRSVTFSARKPAGKAA
jgi:ubiquinone/menaquinone biosynthesis C-methylase UbiE